MSQKDQDKTDETLDPEEKARRDRINAWKGRILVIVGLLLGLMTGFLLRR